MVAYAFISSSRFHPSLSRLAVHAGEECGARSSDPNNYRPIAVTSCLCKMMERMVNKRLMWVLESKGLLALEQCGFRRKKLSTADQLVWFDSDVLAIFSDLEKAYKTTWKHGILSDLYNLNFWGHLPAFIDGFLSHRLFQVRAGSTLFDTYEQEMGVPQGSILSLVLFSLKINNIVKSVLKGLKASLFRDDFATCIRAKFLPHAQRLM